MKILLNRASDDDIIELRRQRKENYETLVAENNGQKIDMNFLIKYLNGGRDVEYISTDDIFSRFYVPEEIINKYISENSHKSMGVLSEAFVKQPVSEEFINRYGDKVNSDGRHNILKYQKNIPLEFIDKYKDDISVRWLLKYCEFPNEYLKNNLDYFFYRIPPADAVDVVPRLIKNNGFSEEIVFDVENIMYKKYSYSSYYSKQRYWEDVLCGIKLSEDFLRQQTPHLKEIFNNEELFKIIFKYQRPSESYIKELLINNEAYIDLNSLVQSQKFSEDFLSYLLNEKANDNQNDRLIFWIVKYQTLSENFINEHWDKLHEFLDEIFEYQDVSEEFVKQHLGALSDYSLKSNRLYIKYEDAYNLIKEFDKILEDFNTEEITNFIKEHKDEMDTRYMFTHLCIQAYEYNGSYGDEIVFENCINLFDWSKIDWGYIANKTDNDYKLSDEFMDKYSEKIDWNYAFANWNLSNDIVEKYMDKVDWKKVIDLKNWDEFDFYRKQIDLNSENLKYQVLSWTQDLPIDFIKQNKDKISWKGISHISELPIDFIKEYADKLDWPGLSFNQHLTVELIDEYIGKKNIHWRGIFENQQFEEEDLARWGKVISNEIIDENTPYYDEYFWNNLADAVYEQYVHLSGEFIVNHEDKFSMEFIVSCTPKKDLPSLLTKEFVEKHKDDEFLEDMVVLYYMDTKVLKECSADFYINNIGSYGILNFLTKTNSDYEKKRITKEERDERIFSIPIEVYECIPIGLGWKHLDIIEDSFGHDSVEYKRVLNSACEFELESHARNYSWSHAFTYEVKTCQKYNPDFSLNSYLEKYCNKFEKSDWIELCSQDQIKLPYEFVEKHSNNIHWDYLSVSNSIQDYPKEFFIKHFDEINWPCLLYSENSLKNETIQKVLEDILKRRTPFPETKKQKMVKELDTSLKLVKRWMEIYGKEDMPYLYSPEEFIEKSYRVINARSFDFDGIEYSKEFADKYKPRFGIDLKVSKKEKDNENIDFDDIEF